MLKLTTATLLTTALFGSHLHAKDSYISFILDRSTSMLQSRVDGSTRCGYSKEFTKQTLTRLYERYSTEGNVYINLELFGSRGSQKSITQGYIKDKSRVMQAIDQLGEQSCDKGSTALADAMCSVGNGMRAFAFGQDFNLIVYGITDGEENDSSFQVCGPSLSAGWQDYIKAKFKGESPRIVYNAAIFTGEDVRSTENEGDGDEVPRSATFEFLINLAKETGGTVTVVNDKDRAPPKQFPVTEAPVNSFQTVKFIKDSQRTCVDVAMFALVIHAGDNNVKRVDSLENSFLQSSLQAQYRDCSLSVICAQAPSQNFTALSYQRVCSSASVIGHDIDGKIMREFDANLNLY